MLTALLSGEVDMVIGSLPTVVGYAKGGQAGACRRLGEGRRPARFREPGGRQRLPPQGGGSTGWRLLRHGLAGRHQAGLRGAAGGREHGAFTAHPTLRLAHGLHQGPPHAHTRSSPAPRCARASFATHDGQSRCGRAG